MHMQILYRIGVKGKTAGGINIFKIGGNLYGVGDFS